MILVFDELVRETDTAYVIRFEQRTIPLSKKCVEDIDESTKKVDVADWLAVKEGLEAYAD